MESNLTRRGFMAVAATVVTAAVVAPITPVTALNGIPGGPSVLTLEMLDDMYRQVMGLGYVRPQSPYWHGLPQVYPIDIRRPWPWEK